MHIVEIFKKYFKRVETKREVLTIVISELQIDIQEKELYIQTLSFLSDIELDDFYIKLGNLLGEIQSREAQNAFIKAQEIFSKNKIGEKKEKEDDTLEQSLFFNSW